MPSAKDRYSITFLPGDGIGPEVLGIAREILNAAAGLYQIGIDYTEYPCGAQYYLDNGVEWEEGSADLCAASDAVMVGPMGAWDASGMPVMTIGDENEPPHPAGVRPLMELRESLELFAQIAPIRLFPGVPTYIGNRAHAVWDPDSVDYLVVREATEGGLSGHVYRVTDEEGHEIGRMTPMEATLDATNRIAHLAFWLALQRNCTRKAPNGLVGPVHVAGLWDRIGSHAYFLEVCRQVAAEEPGIYLDVFSHDDLLERQLQHPETLDVILATSLAGEMAMRVGSLTQGGPGMTCIGFLGETHGAFLPAHGPSPAFKEKGNPFAAARAVRLMVRWLAVRFEDERLEAMSVHIQQAITHVVAQSAYHSVDMGGTADTQRIGNALLEALLQLPMGEA